MNLPEYLQTTDAAIGRFEDAVNEARQALAKEMASARNAFFEDQAVMEAPMKARRD